MSDSDIDLSGLMVGDDNIEEVVEFIPEPEYDIEPVEPAPPMFSAKRQKKIMLIKKVDCDFSARIEIISK